MPERHKATVSLTEHLLGGPIQWDGVYGMVREPQPLRMVSHSFAPREPITLTQTVWDKTFEEADGIYRLIIDRIDWKRVLIQASGLHLTKMDGGDHEDWAVFEEICPECLRDALLDTER